MGQWTCRLTPTCGIAESRCTAESYEEWRPSISLSTAASRSTPRRGSTTARARPTTSSLSIASRSWMVGRSDTWASPRTTIRWTLYWTEVYMCWEGESSMLITWTCRVRLKSQVGRMMNVILNGSLHVLGGGEFHANNLNLQGKIEISSRTNDERYTERKSTCAGRGRVPRK